MLLCCVLTRIEGITATALKTVAVLALTTAVMAFLVHPSVPDAIGIALTGTTAILLVLPLRHAAPSVDEDSPEPANTNRCAGDQDAVAAFGRDLKERLLNGRYRSVTAFADNYALTGVSRSTAYAAVSGARLPTETTTRKLLRMVVGADEQEIADWIARRAEVEAGPSGPDQAPAAPAQRMVRTRDAVVLAAVVAVVSAATSAAVTVTATKTPQNAGVQNDCTPQADLRPHQVVAHVANTQGQGVYARLSPHVGCHTGFLPERDNVTVACQDLHGPVITDFYDGTIRHWPVWDKLSSGAYVPDLYLDLPKQPQPALVDGIPAC